jgi:hypothetical protein
MVNEGGRKKSVQSWAISIAVAAFLRPMKSESATAPAPTNSFEEKVVKPVS